MGLGKSLRLRRIFANGRALIVPLDHGGEDPVPVVRALARSGVDAVALSPGVLERVSEDLAGLAVILRLNGANRTPQLVSVQGALELGAEAVLLKVDAHEARDLERLGRVTEDARRLGMPVIADIVGEDLPDMVTIAAEYGADAIQTQPIGDFAGLRHTVRTAGRPILASTGRPGSVNSLLRLVNNCLEAGGQGVVVEPQAEAVLAGINALVHQGVSVEEALTMADSPRTPVPES
jgi:fructose-bisphosphate aldolase / 2-amino-3,7-dideoxy-D-threo-hept-6-ulosonate synthase